MEGFLELGPIPKVTAKKGRKGKDNASEDEGEQQSDYDDMFEDDMALESAAIQKTKASTRGTVLVTLRNVPPYTDWYAAIKVLFRILTLTIKLSGISQSLRRSLRLPQPNLRMHPILHTFNFAPSLFEERIG